MAENHPKNRGFVGILRGQKCLRRGQKCLKRRFSRRSPVGEWSRGARGLAARSMPRVMTPKQRSTGGRQRLGRISKQGDVYIRRLLILGGTSLEARPAWLAEAPADLPYLKALLAPTLRGYGLLAGVRALATSNCERSGQSFAPPRPYTELDVRADRIITAGTTELAGAGVPSCRAGARTRREAAFRDPGNARRWQDAIG